MAFTASLPKAGVCGLLAAGQRENEPLEITTVVSEDLNHLFRGRWPPTCAARPRVVFIPTRGRRGAGKLSVGSRMVKFGEAALPSIWLRRTLAVRTGNRCLSTLVGALGRRRPDYSGIRWLPG